MVGICGLVATGQILTFVLELIYVLGIRCIDKLFNITIDSVFIWAHHSEVNNLDKAQRG